MSRQELLEEIKKIDINPPAIYHKFDVGPNIFGKPKYIKIISPALNKQAMINDHISKFPYLKCDILKCTQNKNFLFPQFINNYYSCITSVMLV